MLKEFLNHPLSTIALLWLVSAFFDYNNFAYYWQLKEYRFDQFKDFLSTKQGNTFKRGYRLLWRPIFALATYIFLRDAHVPLPIVIIIILVGDLIYNLSVVYKKKIRRPKYTLKAMLILLFTFFLEICILYTVHGIHMIVYFMIIRFFTFSLIVQLFTLPTKVLKSFYVQKATKKLEAYKNLTVIGITGSYGKSSVKTFLGHILSKNKETIVTPKNINTEIGVAKHILKTDFSNIAYYIVEMGAYRKGEIALIAKMVKPTIGILTAIREQHLSIFGTIRNIQQAKFELLYALPKKGLAIANADNPYIKELLSTVPSAVETYGIDNESYTASIVDSKEKKGTLTFTININHELWHCQAPIAGEHNAQNIAACVLAARHLGMKKADIIQAITSISLPEGTLQSYQWGNAIIIDDSYNANVDGFRSALHTVSTYPSSLRRIVVTRGMQELGEQSNEFHEQVGEEIAYSCDELVIISPDNAVALQKGVGNKYKTKILNMYNFVELETYLYKLKEQSAVILFENRLPNHLYKKILDEVKKIV